MQTTLLLVAKIGVLVLLWFFIWMTIRALRRDTQETSGLLPAQAVAFGPAPLAQSAPAAQAPVRAGRAGARGLRRAHSPTSLIITTGPLTGTTLAFQGYEKITIGRSKHCTLQLDDDFASGTHALLIRRGSDWFVEDQDSRNGTWIAGQRIDQPEKLSAGQEIRIGQTQLRMER